MQPLEIRIPGGWALNHESFAKVKMCPVAGFSYELIIFHSQVIFAVYTHYNNLVAYVGAMRFRRIDVNFKARFSRRH